MPPRVVEVDGPVSNQKVVTNQEPPRVVEVDGLINNQEVVTN